MLSEFTDDVFTKAILKCLEFYEMPPTLPQVRQSCRQIKYNTIVDVAKETFVPANPEIALSCLRQCKEILTK